VANRNSGGRARSRKRRPAGRAASRDSPGTDASVAASGRIDAAADDPAARGQANTRVGTARRTRARSSRPGDRPSADDRPEAPWHPLPLSELLILVGIIGVVFGIKRGTEHPAPVLFAGVGAVMLGTFEVSLREHHSGYRSHTLMLAAIPTIVFHSIVILAVAAFTRVPRGLNIGLLVIDAALFAVLFKLLRAGFEDARRERRFSRRR